MGFIYSTGRVGLGFFLILAGLYATQGGYKDYIGAYGDMRAYLFNPEPEGFLQRSAGIRQDAINKGLVYFHAIVFILSGVLMVANVKTGAYLTILAMLC